MKIIDINLTGTTNGSGAKTITATQSVLGYLYKVIWVDGDLTDGVDAVLSSTETPEGVDVTLLTLTDANNDATYYPRDVVHNNAGGALTGTSGGDRTMPLVAGILELVIASGGDTKTGGAHVYILED